MDAVFEARYHRLEAGHWWFIARRDMILRLIRKIYCKTNIKILDVGCAGGHLIRFLEQRGFSNVYGIDNSKNAVQECKRNGIKNILECDAAKTGFSDNCFDIIVASDVLEHIQDEKSALKEWRRLLKDNGTLILFVPAFQFMYGQHDSSNRHFRRYSKKCLRQSLGNAGFVISRVSYWNFILFLPISVLRVFQKLFMPNKCKDQLFKADSIANYFLFRLLRTENSLLESINLPIGVSLFAIAQKNPNAR